MDMVRGTGWEVLLSVGFFLGPPWNLPVHKPYERISVEPNFSQSLPFKDHPSVRDRNKGGKNGSQKLDFIVGSNLLQDDRKGGAGVA